MRVLMLLEHKFPGDVRVDREVDSLHKAGVRVDVAIYNRNKSGDSIINYKWGNVYQKYLSKLNFKFSALALSFPFYFNFWESFIIKLLNNNSYDYIHLHDLPLIKIAIKVSKKYNIPLIVDLHENRPEIMKLYKHVNSFPGNVLISTKRWNDYQAKYVKLVNKLILITPEAKEYYVNNFNVDPNKIFVVPNYIDLPIKFNDYDRAKLEEYKSKKTVVYFGDISERRGVLDIVDVAIIQKDNPEYHFVFIGSGSSVNAIHKLVNKYELSNVDVLGYIPISTAMTVIESCSIGICPFHRNIHHDTTYANKMFQYMALGLPLIVSDCPSQAVIVEKEKAGVIFKAGDSNDLNKKLIDLTKNESEFAKISSNIKHIVQKKYSWDIASKELLKIYLS